jgi:hypothetical protein
MIGYANTQLFAEVLVKFDKFPKLRQAILMDTPTGEQSPQPVSEQPVSPAPAAAPLAPEEKKTSWVSLVLWIVVLAAVIYGVVWFFFLK